MTASEDALSTSGDGPQMDTEYGYIAHGKLTVTGIDSPSHSALWIATRMADHARQTFSTFLIGAPGPDPRAHVVQRAVQTWRGEWEPVPPAHVEHQPTRSEAEGGTS